MTNFEKLQSMPLDVLAEWLDSNGQFDTAPWTKWFAEKYCDSCPSLEVTYEDSQKILGFEAFSYGRPTKCAYCEIYNKCQFFPNLSEIPNNFETIKMWLKETAE